jgi:predicted GNAT family N-acyltransferase
MVHEPDIAIIEAVIGSDLYRQALRLREAILRKPLGLTITEEELADDATRQHFCAISYGAVIGTVSLKPLDETMLQLKQMAVAEDRRRERIGALLLAHSEAWGASGGFLVMVLNARMGAEGFYARFGYLAEGEPFDENTVPHIKMTKRLRSQGGER